MGFGLIEYIPYRFPLRGLTVPPGPYTRPTVVVSTDIAGVLDVGADRIGNAGDEISYEMVVKNTGTTCLQDVNVMDAASGSKCVAAGTSWYSRLMAEIRSSPTR